MAFRECTIKLLQAIEDGLVSRDAVITAALQHMSEDEVRDMCEANGFLEDDGEGDGFEDDLAGEPGEDEETPMPDPIDDFNYVGSRHHY